MSVYEKYNQYRQNAEDECKIGGDPVKAQVFATLALAEATRLNEHPETLNITGALTVDT